MSDDRRAASHSPGRPRHANRGRVPRWSVPLPLLAALMITSVVVPGVGSPEIFSFATAAVMAWLSEKEYL